MQTTTFYGHPVGLFATLKCVRSLTDGNPRTSLSDSGWIWSMLPLQLGYENVCFDRCFAQSGCTRRGSATATVVSSHGDTHCRSDRFVWNRMLYVLTRVWSPGVRVGVATLVLDTASLLLQSADHP